MSGSNDEVLKIEGLWRRYRQWKKRPTSLKETAVRFFQRGGLAYEDFWALRDVSLSVRRSEVVGFCGANGSGKSTLLRTVARILPPTFGRITVRGRIAALLDVTAGFHPDLSGLENIALSGSLMGFTDSEIAGHTDSIVEFADLDEFIDSPIRTYSAGMYMRLGFAIASHVDADILLIDEVLAVGDAEFQKKCGQWFKNLRARDRTVIMVSHDLASLSELCDRVVWLDHGRVMDQGAPVPILREYCPDFVPPPHPGGAQTPEEDA